MRHGVKNKKLGVNAQHKRAILRALTTSILEKGMEAEQSNRYVRTTLHKAKLVRSCVDRMITYAKKGDLSARREASRFVMSPKAVQDLFATIGPRYAGRNGGGSRTCCPARTPRRTESPHHHQRLDGCRGLPPDHYRYRTWQTCGARQQRDDGHGGPGHLG